MTLALVLGCVGLLLGVAVLAVAIGRSAAATPVVYGLCLIASLLSCAAGATHLIGGSAPLSRVLPLGVPWLGAHFRLDALSAYFLAVVGFGSFAASLFALGYGEHEEAPRLVLPFYPAFLAAMILVLIADDAFTFLASWEFMSLTSWALVMAHHRNPDNVRAAYVYLVMAGFGTLALLLAFGLMAGPDGGYAFIDIRNGHASTGLGALVLVLALTGAGSKAGLVGPDLPRRPPVLLVGRSHRHHRASRQRALLSDPRPWLDHGVWGVKHPLGAREDRDRKPPPYAFLPAEGEGLHQIPVGPVHAGIIEPGHFRFTANGETVVRLEERLGYVHKGIESLMIERRSPRRPGSRAARPAIARSPTLSPLRGRSRRRLRSRRPRARHICAH